MNTTIYILMAVIIFILCAIYFSSDTLREEIPYWFGMCPEFYLTGPLDIITIFFRSLLLGVVWPLTLYFIVMLIFLRLIYLIIKLMAFLLGIHLV